ncbi:PEGA domain-containing protein [Deinococcus sp.]|uniref:PEGA domain-containing protein n=1 Tax=Deinococcus sp. TaxID=47478 RepID=UPI0025CED183|nr:PEGA domain-containing protein [Deinococcus sp.]
MPRLRSAPALFALSTLLLTACVPTTLRSQSGSALKVTATLSDSALSTSALSTLALKVDTGQYRRPGPASAQVQLSGPASGAGTYLYGLLLPEAQPGRLIVPETQPTAGTANLALPAVNGFTQLFVVASTRPLVFGPLGSSVSELGRAVGAATAGLAAGSWNVSTLVYRVSDYGALSVRSVPDGANVYVGDTYRGRTPLDLAAVEVGRAQIRIERDGFETESRTVMVASEQKALLNVRLRRQATALLRVTSSVPASVSIRKVGGSGSFAQSGPAPLDYTAPQEYKLLPGAYALTLTPQGSAISPARLGIELARDQTLDVSCAPQGTALVCQTN